jgi:chromate reductase
MVTVISSSNRSQGKGLIFAKHFHNLMNDRLGGDEVRFLSLELLPTDMNNPGMYKEGGQHPAVGAIQDTYLLPAEKWLFVVPEYNGSFPGILKFFLDACSVRKYAETFKGKKVALVGVGSGRGGNIRGMEHLTGILNYLGMNVMPHKLPISGISNLMDENDAITDAETLKTMAEFVDSFLQF